MRPARGPSTRAAERSAIRHIGNWRPARSAVPLCTRTPIDRSVKPRRVPTCQRKLAIPVHCYKYGCRDCVTAAELPPRHQMLTTSGRIHSLGLLPLAAERTRLASAATGAVVTGASIPGAGAGFVITGAGAGATGAGAGATGATAGGT